MEKEPLITPHHNGPDPAWIYPVRSPLDWKRRDGRIVLEYPKNLNRLERALNRVLKGPENIRRPLDDVGTLLWEMSDGEHSLLEIYIEEQERLLETMLKLGLMRLEFHPGGKGRQGEGARKGSRIVVRPAR